MTRFSTVFRKPRTIVAAFWARCCTTVSLVKAFADRERLDWQPGVGRSYQASVTLVEIVIHCKAAFSPPTSLRK